MAEPKTAALFFHDDGYDTTDREIVGRRMAGKSFLKAVALYEPTAQLSICAVSRQQFARFEALLRPLLKGRKDGPRLLEYVKLARVDKLAAIGNIFRPDPALEPMALMRRRVGATAFSITGVTHTLCSVATQGVLAQQVVAPFESWDALICTSQAARRAIEKMHEAQAQYLAERLGTDPNLKARLQLPVIPLGVHCEDFATDTQPMQMTRGLTRRKYGIGQQDLCFLFVGRLNHMSKANPVPMLRALQRAAEQTRRRLHLLQAGIFLTPQIEELYRAAVQRHAPDVQCHFIDGKDDAAVSAARAAADVFTSLADNLQETFGLTPVEAMASGLPSVVSDWNGYRETVRDGIDGILVPTTMTPAGYGEELAMRHALGTDDYRRFVGAAALNVAVDESAAAAAYVALIQNPGLRHRMSEAGRKRAQETFSWQHVYPLYRALWGELDERRRRAAKQPRRLPIMPAHLDPFDAYSHFATRSFGPTTEVALIPGVGIGAWREMVQEPLLSMGAGTPMPLGDLEAIYGQLAAGPTGVKALSELFPQERREQAVRAISWLLKADLVQLVNPIANQDRAEPFV